MGKLMIPAKRYRKADGRKLSLQSFHDSFISQSLPLIRKAMLGETGHCSETAFDSTDRALARPVSRQHEERKP
jgi:hypothetical protein